MKQLGFLVRALLVAVFAVGLSYSFAQADVSDALSKKDQPKFGATVGLAVIATSLKARCEANKILLVCPELNFLNQIFPDEFPACLEPQPKFPPACVNHYYCVIGTIGVRSVCQYSRCTTTCRFNPTTKKYDWYPIVGLEVPTNGFESRLVGTETPECGNYFICEPSAGEKCDKDTLNKSNLGFCIDPLRKAAQAEQPKKDEPRRD